MSGKKAVASESQAKRSFDQIFSPSILPPYYFETVMYQGSVRWGVLLGLEFCIVPIGATDDKKVVRFKIRDMTKVEVQRAEHFQFADNESTQRSAKVLLVVQEDVSDSGSQGSPSGGSSPLGRVFGTARRLISHQRKGSEDGGCSSGSTTILTREECFYVFEPNTKLFEYLRQSYLSMLMRKLYGWKRIDEKTQSKDKITSLYIEVMQDIQNAQSLQDRVDLLDEIGWAARFNMHLKRLILFHSSPLISYITSELRKLPVDKWRSYPDLAQRFGRAEALQYITVLLEAAHKTLFLAWPLFAPAEGKTLLAAMLDVRTGLLQQLISAVMGSLIADDELKATSKLRTPALNAVHMCVAVLYQAAQLSWQLQLDKTESTLDRRTELYAHVVAAVQGPALERRIHTMFAALRAALLDAGASSSRVATVHEYAYVLHMLCKYHSPIRDVIVKNHQEDLDFVLPKFVSRPSANTHPLETRASICFLKTITYFAPEQAEKLRSDELSKPID